MSFDYPMGGIPLPDKYRYLMIRDQAEFAKTSYLTEQLVDDSSNYLMKILWLHKNGKLRDFLGRRSFGEKIVTILQMSIRNRIILIKRARKILDIRPLKGVEYSWEKDNGS